MSGTIREYTGKKSGLSFSSPRRRRRGAFPVVLLGVAILAGGFLVWISRDTHAIQEFLPAGGSVQLRMEDALRQRAMLASSPLWQTLPAQHALWDLREALRSPLPIPEWLARNVLNAELYWTGSIESGEGVLISRMTRAGTIAVRLGSYLPGVDTDHAGGLNLTHVADADLYFAVRGRVLVAGPSRRALIHALTLAPDERVWGDAITPGVEGGIAGRVYLTEVHASQYGIDRIDFSVASTDRSMSIVADAFQSSESALDALVGDLGSPVSVPHAAPVVLAVNTGSTLREFSIALGEYLGSGWPDGAQWAEWEKVDADGSPPIAAIAGTLGPELHVSVHGVDVHEVLPVPEFVLFAPSSANQIRPMLEAYPPPTPGPSLAAVHASWEPEQSLLQVPAMGGESFEPSATILGNDVLLGTSLLRVRGLAEQSPTLTPLPKPYAAYLRVEPAGTLALLEATGGVLAENELLEGHTPESFRDLIADWRTRFGVVESLDVGLLPGDGVVTMEIEARFSAAP